MTNNAEVKLNGADLYYNHAGTAGGGVYSSEGTFYNNSGSMLYNSVLNMAMFENQGDIQETTEESYMNIIIDILVMTTVFVGLLLILSKNNSFKQKAYFRRKK